MSFSRPELLWLALLALPELLVSWRRAKRLLPSVRFMAGPAKREGAGASFAAFSLYASLAAALFLAAGAIALAGPSWGRRGQATERSGLELAFVLDVSRSMEAGDGAPTRLDSAKALIRGIASAVTGPGAGGEGGFSFALVAAKGDAVLLVPMTEDREALDSALDYAGPDTMTSPGTDLEKGIDAGLAAFTENSRGNRLLVLLSDGGELAGSGMRAAEEVLKSRSRFVAVGLGGRDPVAVPGLGGGSLVGADGLPVTTVLESARLRSLAETAGGRYADGSDPGLVKGIGVEASALRASGTRIEYESVDRKGLVAGLALIFLLCSALAGIAAERGGRR